MDAVPLTMASALALGPTRAFLCALVVTIGAGCSPVLNWRELRPASFAASALLPCKPSHSVRQVPLAGQGVRLSMWACKAQELTWALAAADVGQATRVGPVLQALRESTLSNFQARVVRETPMAVPGAAAWPAPAVVWLAGRRPDGAPANGRFVVFANGTQVFQAVVVGEVEVPEAAAETFFESLRVGP